MSLVVPASIDEVDVPWMSRALANVVGDASIEAVTHERLHAQGNAGTVFRSRLTHDGGGGLPDSVVVKLPPVGAEHQRGVSRAGFGTTEAGFYRELAERVPVRTPRCYLAEHDADGRAVLVLEDLGDVAESWPRPSINAEHARVMLAQLANLHARFWNERLLVPMAWLGVPMDRVDFYRDALSALARLLRDHVAGELPAQVPRLLEVLVPRLGAVASYLAGPPFTLVHGDFTHRNCALIDGEPVAFDWQLAQRARGARDVAYLMPFLSLAAGDPRPAALVDEYHRRLCALGVSGYARDALQRDQDLATLDVMQVGMISMLTTLRRAERDGVRAPQRGVLGLLPVIAAGVERLSLIEVLGGMALD